MAPQWQVIGTEIGLAYGPRAGASAREPDFSPTVGNFLWASECAISILPASAVLLVVHHCQQLRS